MGSAQSDEKLVFEDGPVRVEPYIMLKDKSSDEVIERTFHAIEEYLVNAEVDEIDRGMTQIMFERIASYRKGDQESKTDEKLHLILDDAVFLIDKYVKGTYQNNLVFAKDVGDLLQEMKSVLENSALIKWRMAINLNLQSIFEYSSKQETDNDLTAKLRIHSELDEEPIKVEFCRPSFFAKSVLYQLWYNSGRRKYILELENSYHLLDATNRPIYTVSDKDFVLSTDTVKDYVDFFFRAVIGKNGGFLIFTQEMEIPYKRDIDIDENIHKNILEHIQPIEIIESSEEQIAMVANIFFRDALFKSNIVVNKDGTCSLNNEELVLENLPIDTKGFV
ncbi:hypothetical protein [Pedobacter sp. Leaf170]|uniref:hypothetical protein n=1 Tax=Pedobacter sp. Leaf170 TaxID=2876558 RepID=UPI001E420E36|nr:hypothetical protein [Pedobacter sp. Leaf170]